nr:YbaN family protein [Vibrio sp. B1Z05]
MVNSAGTSIKRVFLIGVGVLSLLLGILGIVLPLLPTTPFVLLASACFMRASPRLNRKLRAHPTFGPMIDNWQQNRSMRPSIKRKAYLMMLISFSFSIYLAPIVWIKGMLLVLMLVLFLMIRRLPNAPEPSSNENLSYPKE